MASPPQSGSDVDLAPSDVQDYIALGCVYLFPEASRDRGTTTTWIEVEDDISLKLILPPELQFITRLTVAQWIRLHRLNDPQSIYFRVFLLPDDLRQATLDRQSRALRADLGHLCSRLDTSIEAWNGRPQMDESSRFDLWATGIEKSLFWLFNSLRSPAPNTEAVSDRHSRLAAETLLSCFDKSADAMETEVNSSSNAIADLTASLYPYQARTVATMIQRETNPATNLDPRFELRHSPTGNRYYYNARELLFRRSQPQYEGNRGGILAETMGVGKTVMVIALVLATRHHLPTIPPEYSTSIQVRPTVARLTEMAIAKAGKTGVPLRSHLLVHHRNDFPHLEAQIDSTPIYYEIPYYMRRSNRKNSVVPPPRRLRLCSTTIIVVPRNLLRQWQFELDKHANLAPGGLRVLVLEKAKDVLPSADVIASYDILLFSKNRFEQEAKDGMDKIGRSTTNVRAGCLCPYIGASRIRDCSCLRPEDIYHTPLKDLHFLRLVVDEGHEFANRDTAAVTVATRLVTAERRWVVSGTPAKDQLIDVEQRGSAGEEADETESSAESEMTDGMSDALSTRESFVRSEEKDKASKFLGVLLSNFLCVRPWAGTETELKVPWDEFAFRHEDFRNRTHTAFSQCMAATLNAVVLKTRPEDIKRDITLPPLYVSVTMLKPSYYDIITLNLYNFFISSNAVQSERTDVDYLFHKNNTTARNTLIRNLRASPFFWTGWSSASIESAIGSSEKYLAKEDTLCSPEDRVLLTERLAFAKQVLVSNGWNAMSQSHELGFYVQQWPDEQRDSWRLDDRNEDPMMVGASQLHAAQKFINGRLFDENPLENLAALGEAERERAFTVEEKEKKVKAKEGAETKMGIPVAGLRDKQFSSKEHVSPKKPRQNPNRTPLSTPKKAVEVPGISTSPILKRKRSNTLDMRDLPDDSPLAKTTVVGTVSSKLSYLLSRVIELHKDEKVLIFYDHNDTAWYIQQALDMFHVKHLIYAGVGLSSEQRSKYVVAFDTDLSIRVLLMDVAHGAHGLNVNKASRVFFLNPPLAPHIEAQAIKRAHRIGQTKPVYVETLILEGTIEEAFFKRSNAMTREEHDHAGKEITNDQGMAKIIQEAKSIPLPDDGKHMAPLSVPLQIFGRKGRHDVKIKDIDVEKEDFAKQPKKKRMKKVAFADIDTTSSAAATPAPAPVIASIFG